MVEPTAEERELILRRTPAQIINRIDPDEEYRREQKWKKEQLEYELEQKEQHARFEARQVQESKFQNENTKAYLRQMGWTKFGMPKPNQKFYNEGVCDICSQEVMFLDKRSPHVTVQDYPFTAPFDKVQNGDNFEVKHNCSTVTPAVVQKIWDTIADLNKRLAVYDERERSKLYMPVG